MNGYTFMGGRSVIFIVLESELQIRRGNGDNFLYFSIKILCSGLVIRTVSLSETVLMRVHNIRFHSEIRKVSFELSSILPLIGAQTGIDDELN